MFTIVWYRGVYVSDFTLYYLGQRIAQWQGVIPFEGTRITYESDVYRDYSLTWTQITPVLECLENHPHVDLTQGV